ncbi:YaaR family protein [Metabacillus fastidiosus]|uniref:YaaR family protein n=1 Tax=Metabacillus fastidiosus TaxID=1458 RepID=UPI002E24DBF4
MMKISQDIRTMIEKRGVEQRGTAVSSKGFQDLIQKQGNKLQIEQLNKLMVDIDGAGRRLAKSRNFNELSKYKVLVKRFIQEAVEFGMSTKQSYSWDMNGNSRSLKIVEQVDQTLIELTDEIVNKEQSSIDILAKIGEIKGLLINLYV